MTGETRTVRVPKDSSTDYIKLCWFGPWHDRLTRSPCLNNKVAHSSEVARSINS